MSITETCLLVDERFFLAVKAEGRALSLYLSPWLQDAAFERCSSHLQSSPTPVALPRSFPRFSGSRLCCRLPAPCVLILFVCLRSSLYASLSLRLPFFSCRLHDICMDIHSHSLQRIHCNCLLTSVRAFSVCLLVAIVMAHCDWASTLASTFFIVCSAAHL